MKKSILGTMFLAGAMATGAYAQDEASSAPQQQQETKKEENKPKRSLIGEFGITVGNDVRYSNGEKWPVSPSGVTLKLGTQIAGDGSDKYGSLMFEGNFTGDAYSIDDQLEDQDYEWTKQSDGTYIHQANFYSSNDRLIVSNLEDGLKVGHKFGLLYRSPPLPHLYVYGEVGLLVGKASFGERRLTTRYVTWDRDCPVSCYGSPIKAGDTTSLVQGYDELEARPPRWEGIEKKLVFGMKLGANHHTFGSIRFSKTFGTDPRFKQYDNLLDSEFTVGIGF